MTTEIIAKNTTGSNIFIEDLGIDIAADSTANLTELFNVYRISESSDLVAEVQSGNIAINDGSTDLSISNAINHLTLETEYEDALTKRRAWDNQPNEPDDNTSGAGWAENSEDKLLYIWDSNRGKWLSVTKRILVFNYSGEISQGYLRIEDLLSADIGFVSPRNGTIVGMTANSTGGYEDKTFEIRDFGTPIYSVSYSSLKVIDTTANVDFNQGSILQAYVTSESGIQADWYDANWLYRKPLTVNSSQVSGSSDLTDFPVLINFTSLDFSKARSDGYDIIFIDSTAGVKLDHELSFFNQSTGEINAWVRVPSLSPTQGFEMNIYYGYSDSTNQQNIEAVWDSNYVMVQHLNAASALAQDDSTQYDNDITTEVGDPAYEQTGKIGNAINFDGNDAIEAPDSASLDIVNQVTLSAWINPAAITDWNRIVAKSHTSNSNPWTRYGLLFDSGTHLRMEISNGTTQYSTNGVTIVQTGQWQYAVATFDGSALRVYYNGSQDGITNQTTTITTNDMPLSIARSGFAADYFTGLLDEVRISDVARSPDWIATEYNNQNTPSTFITVGAEEGQSADLVTINPIVEVILAWRK